MYMKISYFLDQDVNILSFHESECKMHLKVEKCMTSYPFGKSQEYLNNDVIYIYIHFQVICWATDIRKICRNSQNMRLRPTAHPLQGVWPLLDRSAGEEFGLVRHSRCARACRCRPRARSGRWSLCGAGTPGPSAVRELRHHRHYALRSHRPGLGRIQYLRQPGRAYVRRGME